MYITSIKAEQGERCEKFYNKSPFYGLCNNLFNGVKYNVTAKEKEIKRSKPIITMCLKCSLIRVRQQIQKVKQRKLLKPYLEQQLKQLTKAELKKIVRNEKKTERNRQIKAKLKKERRLKAERNDFLIRERNVESILKEKEPVHKSEEKKKRNLRIIKLWSKSFLLKEISFIMNIDIRSVQGILQGIKKI